MMALLQEQLPSPYLLVMKASDEASGEIVGVAVWRFSQAHVNDLEEKGQNFPEFLGLQFGDCRERIRNSETWESLQEAFKEQMAAKEQYWLEGRRYMSKLLFSF